MKALKLVNSLISTYEGIQYDAAMSEDYAEDNNAREILRILREIKETLIDE